MHILLYGITHIHILFLYSYDKTITETKGCNLTFRYIDDIMSINNPNFA